MSRDIRPYGLCRTTRNFPGTVSISFETLEALVREVLAGYVQHGARRIAVVSGHAGGAHMEALRQAALALVEETEGLTVLVIGPRDIPLPFLMGDASRASRALGERALQHILSEIVGALQDR